MSEQVDNKVSVLILQHPQEQDRALGTARLTALLRACEPSSSARSVSPGSAARTKRIASYTGAEPGAPPASPRHCSESLWTLS